jgi:hypothetical protein
MQRAASIDVLDIQKGDAKMIVVKRNTTLVDLAIVFKFNYRYLFIPSDGPLSELSRVHPFY